jgi:hypothetical protein
MRRHWLRAIIRMLNTVDEQLGEFSIRQEDEVIHASCKKVYKLFKQATAELNSLYNELQKKDL